MTAKALLLFACVACFVLDVVLAVGAVRDSDYVWALWILMSAALSAVVAIRVTKE